MPRKLPEGPIEEGDTITVSWINRRETFKVFRIGFTGKKSDKPCVDARDVNQATRTFLLEECTLIRKGTGEVRKVRTTRTTPIRRKKGS